MSIVKMMSVTVTGAESFLDAALDRCLESGCFHLEPAGPAQEASQPEQNPYQEILRTLISMNADHLIPFSSVDFSPVSHLSEEEMETYVADCSQRLAAFKAKLTEASARISECRNALRQIEHVKDLRVDMKNLFDCQHICVRLGRLPVESRPKLSYYEDENFLFLPYDEAKEYSWGFYCAPRNDIEKADEIMKSLFFERIEIPDFISGTPGESMQRIQQELDAAQTRYDSAYHGREQMLHAEQEKICQIYCRVKRQYEIFRLRQYADFSRGFSSSNGVLEEQFSLDGYVPASEQQRMQRLFEPLPVALTFRKPDREQRERVPVKLKNGWLTRPFSMFVEMYGLPRYGGLNPTTFVALTYTLLFGIMFGDLGQGLLIALLGVVIEKKSGSQLGAIMSRIGLSSAFFGLVYGSVFGYEHALDPLYRMIGFSSKPLEVMEHTNLVLGGAIAIGVVLILISILLNVFVNILNREYTEAIFGCNGIAGFVFFAAVLAALVGRMLLDINLLHVGYVTMLLVLPTLLMFLREPLGCLVSGKPFHCENVGDFIASNFFEVFEFMLGYATNTLSFVRIGGFVFSHAGMMSVVMMLAEGVSAGASPVVVVFGNLFVTGLEGLLVGIQVLRLEFYEMFSRFYDGDGKEFHPVAIDFAPVLETE